MGNINYSNKWKTNDFNKWCKNGRPINNYVVELYISYSNILDIGDLKNLVNLKTLECSYNQLKSLKGIENLTNLEYLYINNNLLTSLEGIEKLTKLKCLDIYDNKLTSLAGIENLINLTYLNCNTDPIIILGLEKVNSPNNNSPLLGLEKVNCYLDYRIIGYYMDKELGINQLLSLEGIEIFIKLIKNNKKIKNKLYYKFIDSDDYIELIKLFDEFIKCKNDNEIDKYIEEIEQMINELNGFKNYVLK
jgi:hypothetical protein